VAAPATVSSESAPNATGSPAIREGGAGQRAASQETCRALGFSNGCRWGGHGVSDERPSGAPNILLGEPQQRLAARPLMTPAPAEPDVTIFVCVTCRHSDQESVRPGAKMFDAVQARLADREDGAVALRAVECLSVCKRPCTLALAAPGKWTYVVGDLDVDANIDDVIDAALKFAATSDGLIPWRERPKSFRSGVISRVPPLQDALRGA
jgi:predicted metal-binding protein